MTLKVGDKVVCVRTSGWRVLRRDTVYTVHEVHEVHEDNIMYVRLAELVKDYPGHWRTADSFKLADVPATAPFDLLAAMTGKPLQFRSGCDVKFVAYVPDAKPHCQLVLLNPATGNVVTRYANGKSSEEPYSEPGDILVKVAA